MSPRSGMSNRLQTRCCRKPAGASATAPHAAPNLQTAIDRLTQLLSLVGLTALIVGGVGVANAVRGHLDTKRETIAILKCVGAPAGSVFLVYFFEIVIIAAAGIVLGIAAGAALPLVAVPLLRRHTPARWRNRSLYGAPHSGCGSTASLSRLRLRCGHWAVAREVPAAALFRDAVSPQETRPRWRYIAAIALAIAALAALAVTSAAEPRIAWIYLAVAAGANHSTASGGGGSHAHGPRRTSRTLSNAATCNR